MVERVQNSLLFESAVSEVLSTVDGSVLDGDCSRSYGDASATKTSEMMTRIGNAMTEWAECDGVAEIATSSQSYVVLGDQVMFES